MRGILISLLFVALAIATPTSLNLTAITAQDGSSIFQCWTLQPNFTTSTQAGTSGTAIQQLGALSDASYTVLPGNYSGGRHNAPTVQYVVFTSGLAHISLPNSSTEAWVTGGEHGLIIAADIANVSVLGHITTYPTAQLTTALQIPTFNNIVPSHKVLHSGPCTQHEQALDV